MGECPIPISRLAPGGYSLDRFLPPSASLEMGGGGGRSPPHSLELCHILMRQLGYGIDQEMFHG